MNKDAHITDAHSQTVETPQQITERIRIHADNYWTLRNKLILITTLGSSVSLCLSLFSLIVASYLAYTNTQTQRDLREQDFIRQEELGKRNFERQRSLKETDLRPYFQQRYDDLAYETKARAKSKRDAEGYYKRFWDLQFEQYQYCQEGLIDTRIFTTWMASRRLEYDEDKPVGTMSYRDGWKFMSDWFTKHDYESPGHYTEFVNFMNEVFDGKRKTCEIKSKTIL